MEKIPVAPYRTYLNKYKTMTYQELEDVKPALEEQVKNAEEEHYQISKSDAGKLEYDAWLKLRDLKAELGVLEHMINSKWVEECLKVD